MQDDADLGACHENVLRVPSRFPELAHQARVFPAELGEQSARVLLRGKGEKLHGKIICFFHEVEISGGKVLFHIIPF